MAMRILECIEEQLSSTNLPLVGITLAAVPCPDTPVLLMLHWHGFRRDFLYESRDASPVAFRPVPVSALQLNEQWEGLRTLDLAALEAGWELGAWDVARLQRRSCMRPGADAAEGAPETVAGTLSREGSEGGTPPDA